MDQLLETSEVEFLANNNVPSSVPVGTAITAMDILNAEYGGETPRPTLPPVSDALAKTMTKWLRDHPTREKIKSFFQEALVPPNVEGLQAVKINEALYRTLPFYAKVNDQRLRGINTYFTRGVGPLVSILDSLIQFEAGLRSAPSTVQVVGTVLKVGESEIDVVKIRKLLDSALKLLCTGNCVTLLKRKTGLKPHLNVKYHHLLRASNPVSDELLGANVEQKVTDSTKLMEVGMKMHKREGRHGNFRRFHRRSDRGRSHGGRGYGGTPTWRNRTGSGSGVVSKRGHPRGRNSDRGGRSRGYRYQRR